MAFVPLFRVCLIRWSEERSRFLALNYLSNCSSYLQTDKHSHKHTFDTPLLLPFSIQSVFLFLWIARQQPKNNYYVSHVSNTHVLTYNAHYKLYESRIHNRLVSVYKRVFHNMRQKFFRFVVAKQSISNRRALFYSILYAFYSTHTHISHNTLALLLHVIDI